MSSLKYKSRVRYDRNYHFKSFFNGNTGFYVRSGVIGYKGEDTGIDPFMSSFPELIDVGIIIMNMMVTKFLLVKQTKQNSLPWVKTMYHMITIQLYYIKVKRY